MKKIYGYAFASALMALASCSSDAPEMNEPNPIQGDVVGYIKMNLPEGSRAADGKTYVKFYKNGSEVAFEETSTENVYALKAVPDMVIAFQNDGSLVNNRTSTTTNKEQSLRPYMVITKSVLRYLRQISTTQRQLQLQVTP